MSTVIQLLIVLVLGAIFMAATAAIWVQRSPRRATLSTLKVATATAKASAPARGPAGIVPPVTESARIRPKLVQVGGRCQFCR